MSKVQVLSSLLQRVPAFRGKRRIGRILLDLLGVSGNKNLFIKSKSGTFYLPNLIEIISFELFVNGYYEKGLVELLINTVPKNGVFIDVGANIGSISIPLARSRPDIKIIAVEASAWIFKILAANAEINQLKNLHTVNYAVYHESGKKLEMFAPKELFGKGSLKAVYTSEAEAVETITIDDIKRRFELRSIDFIKVDVEGFESSVFKGMDQVSKTDKPKIIFEFSGWAEKAAGFQPGESQTILLEKGYQIKKFDRKFAMANNSEDGVYTGEDANLYAF